MVVHTTFLFPSARAYALKFYADDTLLPVVTTCLSFVAAWSAEMLFVCSVPCSYNL